MDIKTNKVIKDTKIEVEIGGLTLHGETYTQIHSDFKTISVSANPTPKKGEMPKGGSGNIRASTFEELDTLIVALSAARAELQKHTEKV